MSKVQSVQRVKRTVCSVQFLSKGSGVDDVTLSKTEDQGAAASATQEDEHEVQQILTPRQQWFLYFDYKSVHLSVSLPPPPCLVELYIVLHL